MSAKRIRSRSLDRAGEIVALLRRHGPLSVAALADRLPISAAGVRAHLRVLEAWGEVRTRLETAEEREGRLGALSQRERERMRRSPRQILYESVLRAAA